MIFDFVCILCFRGLLEGVCVGMRCFWGTFWVDSKASESEVGRWPCESG